MVLIFKSQNPWSQVDFRLIDLCNAIYKVISKLISERLSHIPPHVIEETHGAFIKQRGAAPTILVRLEILQQLVNVPPRINRLINIAIKLGLSKSFDRVEWPFIFPMLKKLEFSSSFTHLIHQCLHTTKIVVLFNQSKTSYFYPTRGLRQEDPLSPLLFLICIHGLFCMLQGSL